MAPDRVLRTTVSLCAAILIFAALKAASGIMAPIACAVFATAVAWPLQRTLQARLPKLVALALTILVTIVIVVTLGSMVVWGVSRVAAWLLGNSARFQILYQQKADWLAEHDIFVGSLAMEHFNIGWVIRVFQEITARLQGFISFAIVTFIFLMLGLLEVDTSREKFAGLANRAGGQLVLRASTETAAKFRRYMLVRTLMSIMTGVAVWVFARLTGLDLAVEWGVIAFAMNYIPFIGPLAATLLPTLLAIAQFESVRSAVLIFLCLNLIQFIIGSYLEPRIAGATVALSPFMVLFAVFFGSFLWGIAGAFIGVPVLIAAVTICAQSPTTAWVAELLSGAPSTPTAR
jgi:predicted PurR-regulated permease PerM